MAWRVAKSLDKLRSQVNAQWPNRDKSSDGTIGDERHQASTSDHNAWVKDGKMGVVTALDITNDPDSGPISDDLAEALKLSRDPRIKYIISNAEICSGDGGPQPWVWRKYSGSNAHRKHLHLSVKSTKTFYDSVKPWAITGKPAKFIEPVATIEDPDEEPEEPLNVQPVKTVPKISVETVQKRLDAIGYHEVGGIDGVWGGKTAAAIAAFKNDRGVHGEPVIDQALTDALDDLPLGWTRPIAPERANVTAKEMAPKVESVRQTLWQRFSAKVVGIGASIAALFKGASDYFDSLKEQVQPFMSWFTGIPTWVWFAGLAAGALLWYVSANRATNSIVDDKRSGRLN